MSTHLGTASFSLPWAGQKSPLPPHPSPPALLGLKLPFLMAISPPLAPERRQITMQCWCVPVPSDAPEVSLSCNDQKPGLLLWSEGVGSGPPSPRGGRWAHVWVIPDACERLVWSEHITHVWRACQEKEVDSFRLSANIHHTQHTCTHLPPARAAGDAWRAGKGGGYAPAPPGSGKINKPLVTGPGKASFP